MKLGFLPLFKPESFGPDKFTATGLEYISANLLPEIIAYVQSQFAEIQVVLKLALNEMLRQKPDVVLLWATSSCFHQVAPSAESLKTYLGIPVWLAGPHISYVPQMLPRDVDIGIIGEVELPLQQLLQLYLRQPDAGPMHYRKVPGIVYQSKGRMYSGAPAQIIPQLSQLPTPNHRILQELPGCSAPVIRTSRSSDAIVPTLAYPPSRKPRLYSPEQICAQLAHIADNYRQLYKTYPIPEQHLKYMSPVVIADYAFVSQRQRLEALMPMYRQLGLHERLLPIPNVPLDALTPERLKLLKSLNVRSVLLVLGPLHHRNPLIPACLPDKIEQVLKLCQQHHIGIVAQLLLNPDVGTTRRQLAQTYLFLREHQAYFQKITVSALGVIPGTPVWDQYVAQVKPDVSTLMRLNWQSLDLEKYAYDLPLHHTALDRYSLGEIYIAFRQMTDPQEQMNHPLREDMFDLYRERAVREFAARYLRAGDKVLDVPMHPELALKPLLPQFSVYQLEIRHGRLTGSCPEAVDMIVLNGGLNALRDPEAGLRQLTSWLKPDGKMLIQWLNPLHWRTLSNLFSWKPRQSTARNLILKHIKLEELEAMLRRCGLEPGKPEYTIIEDVETVRPSVESLAAKLEYHASLRIPQHMLYVSEIKMLARNRS